MEILFRQIPLLCIMRNPFLLEVEKELRISFGIFVSDNSIGTFTYKFKITKVPYGRNTNRFLEVRTSHKNLFIAN